jgi:hypothetical protein
MTRDAGRHRQKSLQFATVPIINHHLFITLQYRFQASTMTAVASALDLNPLRDGSKSTWNLLYQNPRLIRSVQIRFNATEAKHDVDEHDLLAMFEYVGSQLPKLEHLQVRLELMGQATVLSRAIPPVECLTSLLAEAKQLRSLSLVGLSLLGADFELWGLVECLRIHPALQSFEMKDCSFANRSHLQSIKKALYNIPTLKHSDLFNNWISNVPFPSSSASNSSLTFTRRLGFLPFFLGLCILVCAVLVYQPTYRTGACKLYNNHFSAVFQVPLTCAADEPTKKFWQRSSSRNKRS